MKRPLLVWLALLVPLWCVLVIGTHWEPIMRDGWGHWMFHRHVGLSAHSLYDFAKGSYLHNNPRLGQVLTMLVFTPGPYHSIVTPLVEIGVFYMLAALVLGRWPSWRRTDDALLLATIVAICFLCTRSLGPMLFYRPFTGNYLFGLAINLLWLIPYRFATKRAWWFTPVMLVLGAAAGLSNEHTAPAFALAAVIAVAIMYRRGDKLAGYVPWALAGLIGFLFGFVALLKAPGQDFRYSGLATQQTILERILDRGAAGNGKILGLIALYMLPSVPWIILAFTNRSRAQQTRERRVAELVCVLSAVVIVLTLLASPKQGDRLYFAPICLIAAAIASWVTASLQRIQHLIAIVGAAAVIVVVSIRLLLVYHTAHAEFANRMATIENAAPGSTVTVPTYSQPRSRWILGDDFTTAWLRANLALEFKLTAIELAQRSDTVPPAPPPAPAVP